MIFISYKFYKNGGKHLYIDEVHKYKQWSTEIKNIYDQIPDLQIVYTGSSILDLEKGGADLSRRQLKNYMYGMSFREWLQTVDVRIKLLIVLVANHAIGDVS